jgi:hypothetical protein
MARLPLESRAMRTYRVFGLPILLVGVLFLALSFNLFYLLNVTATADIQSTEIQLGSTDLGGGTALFLQYLFFILGVELVVPGALIAARGRSPPQ